MTSATAALIAQVILAFFIGVAVSVLLRTKDRNVRAGASIMLIGAGIIFLLLLQI